LTPKQNVITIKIIIGQLYVQPKIDTFIRQPIISWCHTHILKMRTKI